MTTMLDNLFRELFLDWLQSGTAPDSAIEGITPEFAGWLATQPDAFTFDELRQSTPSPRWIWTSIEFSDIFDGQFYFYVPADWVVQQQASTSAAFWDSQAHQQSITLLLRSAWHADAVDVLQHNRIVAFSHTPLLRPYYNQWVFVTANDAGTVTAYGVYSSGDWLVVVAGIMPRDADWPLTDHMTALINSSPWYGWIQAAKAQRQ